MNCYFESLRKYSFPHINQKKNFNAKSTGNVSGIVPIYLEEILDETDTTYRKQEISGFFDKISYKKCYNSAFHKHETS